MTKPTLYSMISTKMEAEGSNSTSSSRPQKYSHHLPPSQQTFHDAFPLSSPPTQRMMGLPPSKDIHRQPSLILLQDDPGQSHSHPQPPHPSTSTQQTPPPEIIRTKTRRDTNPNEVNFRTTAKIQTSKQKK